MQTRFGGVIEEYMDSIKTKEKAVVYVRVSTEEQKKTGISLKAQEITCRKKAEEMGYKSVLTIKDEGKSAGTVNRAGLQKIIQMCKNKEIEIIFTIHSDRLARNTEDHLMLQRLFKENDVKIVYVLQPDLDCNTATGKTMDTIVAAFNEMQRNITREKTMNALQQKVEEGWFPGVAPLGYKNVKNPKFNRGEISKRIIIPDPKTASFIVKMFKLYATGDYNVYDLLDILYKQGLRSKRGNKPPYSRIYESLKNPIYIGELHWGGIVVKKAKHKPLIDKWTFGQVQLILDGHNNHACRKRKYSFLLRGFLYCTRCGKRFTAEWHTKKSGLKFAYYHCPQRYGCKLSKYVETEILEQQVEEKFKEIQFADNFISAMVEKSKNVLEERQLEIAKQKQAFHNQKKAVEKRKDVLELKLLDSTIKDSAFTRLNDKLEDEINMVQNEIEKLERTHDLKIDELREILKFTKDIYRTYKNAPFVIKRHYLAFFWNRFEVKKKKIIKSEPTELFKALMQTGNIIKKSPKNAVWDKEISKNTNKIIIAGIRGG